MSGATLFAGSEIKQGKFGDYSDQIWDDVKDAEEIKAAIRDSPTRAVDNLVISAASGSLQTALIVGPLIYGSGQGPINQRSIQAPEIAKAVLNDGSGFRFNAGLNRWSTIHIGDLGELLTKLVASAITQAAGSSVADLWNDQGFYLPDNGAVVSPSTQHLFRH